MEKKKILVVEDEFLIAKGTKYILEEEGYDVIANVDCFDCAVDMIEERQPDLVLIDININGEMDGIALGRYLLNKDDIPFIYVSSYTDKITMERVKDTRPYGFVVKPYKEVDLITTVSLVLSNFKQRLLDPKRNEELEESKIDEVPFRIRAVVDYINEHINEKIEITELTELTKWKIHHFIRVFSNIMGVTPYQYILRKKIEKAKAKLEETDQSISEIAFGYGFLSYSNFCIAFKKIAGETPESYRIKAKTQRHFYNT